MSSQQRSLGEVAGDVLAYLANQFLDDSEATSLACTAVALLHALRDTYNWKRECLLDEYLHTIQPRTLDRIGAVTCGVVRRARVPWDAPAGAIAQWRALLADGRCRLAHLNFSRNLLPRDGGLVWPPLLCSVDITDWEGGEKVDLAALPLAQLTELTLGPWQTPVSTDLTALTSLRTLIFGGPSAGLRLPASLTSLTFLRPGDGLTHLRLPASLTRLVSYDAFPRGSCPQLTELEVRDLDEAFDGRELAHSLQTLRLIARRPLDHVTWPPALHTLEFEDTFTQTLDKVVFPPTLTRLTLGERGTGERVKALQLPSALRSLELPQRWLGDGGFPALPASLTSLKAVGMQEGSLVDVAWPAGLTELELPQYTQSLAGVRLPTGLLRLVLGGEAPLDAASGFEFPPSLTDLQLQVYDPVRGARLPANLRHLTFVAFDQAVDALELPHSLEALNMGHDFTQPVAALRLPASLQMLEFGYRWDQPLDDLQLPDGLTHLRLGSSFHQRLDRVRWPPRLAFLHCGHRFNQPMASVRLPATVAYLNLGSRFSCSLLAFQPPACLARLIFPLGYDSGRLPVFRNGARPLMSWN